MFDKSQLKRPASQQWRDAIVVLPLRVFLFILQAFPYRAKVVLGGWFMRRLVGKVTNYERRIDDNLKLVKPQLTRFQRQKISSSCLDNCGRMFAEHNAAHHFVNHVKNSNLTGAGLDNLREAHLKGQGVVFATGHFGNFEAGRAVLIHRVKTWQTNAFATTSPQRTNLINEGQILGGLYRPTNNLVYEQHHLASFSYIGEPVFPRSIAGLRDMMAFLRASGWLMVLHDVRHVGGIPIKFMGVEARTSISAARLALSCDALLVPFYGVRLANGFDFEIVVEEPIVPASAEVMTTKLTKSLEKMVNRYPDQWLWVHQRWRL